MFEAAKRALHNKLEILLVQVQIETCITRYFPKAYFVTFRTRDNTH